MSLQVWLPMTEDLRQQGLSDIAVVNNGATFNSSGKLGGCYSFDGNDEIQSSTNLSITGDASYSISFWFYWDADSWSTDYVGVVGFGSMSTLSGAFACLPNGYPDLDFWNQRYKANSQLSVKTWYHLTFTKETGTKGLGHIYVNGVEVPGTSSSATVTPNIAAGKLLIGRLNATSARYFKGKISDVRIYDHCLSPTEVKRISQGLILHYPLNNMGFGQENLAKNSNLGWNSTAYNVIQGNMAVDWVVGETYTISIKGTPSTGCHFWVYPDTGWYRIVNLTTQVNGIWVGTGKCTNSNNVSKFAVYDGPKDGVTHNSHIEWIKIEKGSIATPWSPALSDTLADTMGLNSNIEYDSSGYCHNANRASGHDNLLLSTPKLYNSSAYNAYQLYMSENLKANQTYTIQFWDVSVSHSAKSAADLGIDVYWGGGSIRLKYWHGTSYFTNGHADHLVGTFTVTDAQASGSGSANSWLNLYNSVSNVDGTRSMSIGKWKLEKGSTATSWTPGSYKAYTTDSPKYSVSAEFDGVDSATVSPIFDSTTRHSELTTAAWVKRTSDDANWHYYWYSQGISLDIRPYESVNNYYNVNWTHATDSSSRTNGWINNVMPLNTWVHDVWVFDHGVMKHYINGELAGTSDRSGTGTYILGDVTGLMGGETSTSHTWQGGLSDFRIYATALSATDIKSLYQNSATIDADGTIHGAIR